MFSYTNPGELRHRSPNAISTGGTSPSGAASPIERGDKTYQKIIGLAVLGTVLGLLIIVMSFLLLRKRNRMRATRGQTGRSSILGDVQSKPIVIAIFRFAGKRNEGSCHTGGTTADNTIPLRWGNSGTIISRIISKQTSQNIKYVQLLSLPNPF